MLGCELTASAFVERQWVVDDWAMKAGKPDMTTRLELKATKLVGHDAKMKKLREVTK